MKIAAGTSSYVADENPIKATGLILSDDELNAALAQRLPPLLRDAEGRSQASSLLTALAATAFAAEHLNAALSVEPKPYDWQIGEAMSEAYLVDHCDCEFPWPHGRQ